jgi:hypothetical protein
MSNPTSDLLDFVGHSRFATVLADPPWQFVNRTGKVAPEHRRLSRYGTMTLEEILALPVAQITEPAAHLYLWVPNALLPDGLAVMKAWGFTYKSNLVWHKVRKDGGSDGRGVAWQDLYMDSLNQNTPPGFDAVVGATVPNTIVIAPITAQAGGDVPALKPYAFAMVQKKLVIVNPSDRKIAGVIAQ